MENKLKALKAELDLLKEGFSVEYQRCINLLDCIIDTYFKQKFDAICIRRWVRESSSNGFIDVFIELGFHNVEENRTDFGSDMFFEFCSKNGVLRLNQGTCGYYSKHDIYQVRRAKLVSDVWEHIDEIEKTLQDFSNTFSPMFAKYNEDQFSLEREINHIEEEIKTSRLADILSTIKLGTRMTYFDDCPIKDKYRHIRGICYVTKITPKFVTLVNEYDECYKTRVNNLIEHIDKNYIKIVKED